jgi:hypothetical protein
MSYEYSSESRRLDFPNPYKVENYFLFIAAAILSCGGITLLILSRGSLAEQVSAWSLAPLGIGVLLLLKGIAFGAQAMSQLRFFFGRGEPAGLAREVVPEQECDLHEAKNLKETLRQNALTLQEPRGPLNGLLYSLIPALIYAPARIRNFAQRMFQTGLAMLATLLSFLVAWVGFSGATHASLMGLFYFGFTLYLLLRPLEQGFAAQAEIGVQGLMVLVLAAVFGPVLIPMTGDILPDLSWLSLNGQILILLLSGCIAIALAFVAMTQQIVVPAATTVACEQTTLSFNAHPKQILDELDRELQKNWVDNIPNRRYSKSVPDILINEKSGSFRADLLEETQPMPRDNVREPDLAGVFSEPRHRWLAWLNVFGLVLMVLAIISLVRFGGSLDTTGFKRELIAYATYGGATLLLANFCFKAGNPLWGRFDFVSDLIWIEMNGNYQAATLEYGNEWTDRIKTQKQVINVETMTLRVWIAQLDTVAFGKLSGRALVGMQGLSGKSKYLAEHIVRFASGQNMIVAPTAQGDMQKIATLAAMNNAQNHDTPHPLQEAVMQAVVPHAAPGTLSTGTRRLCSGCGHRADPTANFCSGCGLRLAGETSA